jgi:hypothetical protein
MRASLYPPFYCSESAHNVTFFGVGRELEQAVRRVIHLPPKDRFVSVSAREFLDNPYKYGSEGHWDGVKVDS